MFSKYGQYPNYLSQLKSFKHHIFLGPHDIQWDEKLKTHSIWKDINQRENKEQNSNRVHIESIFKRLRRLYSQVVVGLLFYVVLASRY